MIQKNKKYFFITLSILFSLLGTILVIESYVRIFLDDGKNLNIEMLKYAKKLKKISKDKKIGIEHKKNQNIKLMNVNIKLNSQGFRNDYNLNQSKIRILMLGDSMTFGWGANKTFSNNLEEKLGDKFQVINAGIGNTNTYMQVNNFFENYRDYNFDFIILNFFINDLEKVKVKKGYFIVKNFYIYTFLKSKINEILIKFSLKNNWNEFYSKTFDDEKFINKTFNEILRLSKYCNKNNIPFVINNIPELRDLKNYQFDEETNLIKKFTTENNIIFLNSIQTLKNNDEESLWVSAEDPHLNDKAHLLIANFLYEKLLTEFNSL